MKTTTKYVVVVSGTRVYAFGPFATSKQAEDYASVWLANANYQVVPLTKPIVRSK
jgi:hypothetical protein